MLVYIYIYILIHIYSLLAIPLYRPLRLSRLFGLRHFDSRPSSQGIVFNDPSPKVYRPDS